MAKGKFTSNGTSAKVACDDDGMHVTVQGTWGGGTVSVMQDNGLAVYENGTAITMTADDDFELRMKSGDKLYLVLSGATSPDLTWIIR